jgi:CheY-like chemotaxis protein/HPt (histidine-containing phosphotransfer) domain-containing protein
MLDMISLALGRRSEGARPKMPVAESRISYARILVAEDNAVNQLVARKIIEKLGYRADVAATGKEALAALANIPYDLVLMDCQMPEMDGFEATRAIRRGEAGKDRRKTPVIAMTARAMQGDREECLASGMNDYLSKPIDPPLLAKILTRWLVQKNEDDPAVPVFDRKALEDRLMGDEALIGEMIDIFLEDTLGRIEVLKGHARSGDVDNARAQAHSIKGAAANIGGEVLRRVALEIEKAGKAGDIERVRQMTPQLEKQFDQLKATMRERVFRSEP